MKAASVITLFFLSQSALGASVKCGAGSAAEAEILRRLGIPTPDDVRLVRNGNDYGKIVGRTTDGSSYVVRDSRGVASNVKMSEMAEAERYTKLNFPAATDTQPGAQIVLKYKNGDSETVELLLDTPGDYFYVRSGGRDTKIRKSSLDWSEPPRLAGVSSVATTERALRDAKAAYQSLKPGEVVELRLPDGTVYHYSEFNGNPLIVDAQYGGIVPSADLSDAVAKVLKPETAAKVAAARKAQREAKEAKWVAENERAAAATRTDASQEANLAAFQASLEPKPSSIPREKVTALRKSHADYARATPERTVGGGFVASEIPTLNVAVKSPKGFRSVEVLEYKTTGTRVEAEVRDLVTKQKSTVPVDDFFPALRGLEKGSNPTKGSVVLVESIDGSFIRATVLDVTPDGEILVRYGSSRSSPNIVPRDKLRFSYEGE